MSSASEPLENRSYRQENRNSNQNSTRDRKATSLATEDNDGSDLEQPQKKNGHRDEYDPTCSTFDAKFCSWNNQKSTVQPLADAGMNEDMYPSEPAYQYGASPTAKPRRECSMSPSPSQRSPPAESPQRSQSRSQSRSRSRSPEARTSKPHSKPADPSRSKSPSPSKRRGSYNPSRSKSPEKDVSRSLSRSRSRTPEKQRRGATPPARVRRGASPARRGRSISRERDYRRRDRSGERSRDRGRVSDRGNKAARPDTSQYRSPEKWLLNLFEDSLRETLETTHLPCNVSKINDCMRRLDPTYKLEETDFPSFSVMCHWFDDVGKLLEVSKRRDSVMLLGSRLERHVVKRLRTPPRGGLRGGRNKRRGRRSPPGRRRRGNSPDRREGVRGGRRGGDSRSRSPARGGARGKQDRGDGDDRWEMA